jgi:pyruvate carboxylase
LYYPFESDLKASTAEIYDHEIPGGQYSNLRPQVNALGLGDQFETVKRNYKIVNQLFGDIVKVTPSSKVVGDMAIFMTSNQLTTEDVLGAKGEALAFPESVKQLIRGDLGQNEAGWPSRLVEVVLKGEKPYTDAPNAHLPKFDFDAEFKAFVIEFGEEVTEKDFLSYKMYPKVFQEYLEHFQAYGAVRSIPTKAFFYGLEPNEEILVELEKGKTVIVQYLNMTEADPKGYRTVFFRLNGSTRAVQVKDTSIKATIIPNKKAEHSSHMAAPLQGSLARVLVQQGQEVEVNAPLFVIEAMKMESTVTAPYSGVVGKIHLSDKTLVEQNDLVLELIPQQN